MVATDMANVLERPRASLLTQLQISTLSKSRVDTSYSGVASDEIELISVHNSDFRPPGRKSRFNWRQKWDGIVSSNARARPKSWRLLQRRLLSRVLPIILIMGVIVLVVLMSVAPALFFHNMNSACNPNGEFSLSIDQYTPWQGSGIFAINMRFGSLDFWQAKFVDISWDVVVGRGGQALLALFTYVVFTKGLTRRMQNTAVPHDTFKAITLQNDTFFGLWRLITNFTKFGGHRMVANRVWMVWMILSAGFVLLVPTWLSAMTGYVSDLNPYVTLENNNAVPLESFTPAVYFIYDAVRLNVSQWVTVPWSNHTGQRLDYSNYYGCYPFLYFNSSNGSFYEVGSTSATQECRLFWAVSRYVHEYGFLGERNTSSKFWDLRASNSTNWTSIELAAPTLNISAAFAVSENPRSSLFNWAKDVNSPWYSMPSGMSDSRFQGNPLFYHEDTRTSYSLKQLRGKARCQQTEIPVRYQWGFSFILLYTFVATLMLWILGMVIYYFDASANSLLNDRRMGDERAVLDLAQSMQLTLDKKASDLCSSTELRESTKNDTLSYANLPFDTAAPTPWMLFKQNYSFKRWLTAEKWWLVALLVCTILWAVSVTAVFPLTWFLMGWIPGLGIFFVLVVGEETYGRWVLSAFFSISFAVLMIVFSLMYSRKY